MAVYFGLPDRRGPRKQVIDRFLGIDYSNDPGNVKEIQSPWAPNMIRDVPGKARKCMGFTRMTEYSGRINGAHRLRTTVNGKLVTKTVLHAGTTLYDKDSGAVVYEGAADERSSAVQMQDAVWFLDGKQLLKLWLEDGVLKAAQSEGYVPTVTISKEPGGGGTAYEALNLLQPKFTETFFGDGESTVYHLSFDGLDSVDEVKVMNDGEWEAVTDYTVDLLAGTVTFAAAPAEGVGGEDNVSITAAKTQEGYAERIGKCRICTLYGVNGSPDRMFVTGNSEFPNRDWYSAQNDPTYWPDTGYSILGGEKSAVMGYAIVNSQLAAYKDEAEPERAVILRSGTLNEEGDAVFVQTGTLAGPGVIAPASTAYLENEPLALTAQGVYALTTSDVTGERHSQNRSFYADGRLLELEGLADAVACVHGSMYWLCCAGEAYLLDGLQPLTAGGKPYSTRVYAAWHRTNLPARVMWTEGDELWFGSSEGVVYRFYTDPESPASYNDDGAPVGGDTGCCWTTPEFGGSVFWNNKHYSHMAVQMRAGLAGSVVLSAMRHGVWMKLREAASELKLWSWENFSWENWQWAGYAESATLVTRARLTRLAQTRYRVENGAVNEPMGLMAIGFEYTEPGSRYRR